MLQYKALIKKFDDQGEKTGWTYIEVPAAIAQKLKPNNKRSFRVKGSLDNYPFEAFALLPMGEGNFIMALNATIRKKIGKRNGASIKVTIAVDSSPVKFNAELMECLADEPECLSFFKELSPGHQKYFSNWIDTAKTEVTKTKRIALTLDALSKRQNYGQMIRAQTERSKDRLL